MPLMKGSEGICKGHVVAFFITCTILDCLLLFSQLTSDTMIVLFRWKVETREDKEKRKEETKLLKTVIKRCIALRHAFIQCHVELNG